MIAHIAALFLKKELSSLEITSCAATEEDAKALALEGIQKEAINITKNNHDWLVKTQRDVVSPENWTVLFAIKSGGDLSSLP